MSNRTKLIMKLSRMKAIGVVNVAGNTRLTKEGISSKNSYGSEFIGLNSILKTRKRRNDTVDGIPPAYATKPTIAEKKKKSLIGLIEKRIIPAYYMSFYSNL